jgi:hypothetical protein
MRCSGGGPSRLQSARLVAAVAELGSLGGIEHYENTHQILGLDSSHVRHRLRHREDY